jgi:hypothetical protein
VGAGRVELADDGRPQVASPSQIDRRREASAAATHDDGVVLVVFDPTGAHAGTLNVTMM